MNGDFVATKKYWRPRRELRLPVSSEWEERQEEQGRERLAL